MKIMIKRWGNGAGLPLSKALRKHLRADIGDKLDVQILDHGLLICRTGQERYTLEELLISCTFQLDEEDYAWLHAAPVGKEI